MGENKVLHKAPEKLKAVSLKTNIALTESFFFKIQTLITEARVRAYFIYV